MKKPQFVSILHRKLKPNATYQKFYEAWLPPNLNGKNPVKEPVQYFNSPVQVINAVNVKDPTDIISIGLIWATAEEVEKDVERTKATDEARGKKIAQVTDKSQETKFYQIQDVNLLGTDLPRTNES